MGITNNIKWVSFSQLIKISTQMLGIFIFSRLLSPQEIGLMSLVLVVINFTNILRDMGTSSALIQKDILDDKLISVVFSFNLIIGVILLALLLIFSDDISIFFNQPNLSILFKVVAFTFPINTLTSVHLSLLERDSQFNSIAKIEIYSSILSLFIALILCYSGLGVISVVIQTLIYTLASAWGFIRTSTWKTKISYNFALLKEILPFTMNVVSFNFINYFSRNTDQAVICKYFSSSVLGYYTLAYRLMLFPVQNITFVLTRSLYPILSRNQNDNNESLISYFKILKIISLVTPPLMLGLSAVSKYFIIIFFGEKWLPVSSIILLLAPVGILQSFVSTTGSVFMAKGKANVLLYISIYNAILQISAFLIGVFFNLDVMLYLYLISNILMFIPNMLLSIKLLNGSLLSFMLLIYKPIFCSLFMYLGVISVSKFISSLGPVSSLITLVLTGVALYTFLIFLFERAVFKEFIRAARLYLIKK